MALRQLLLYLPDMSPDPIKVTEPDDNAWYQDLYQWGWDHKLNLPIYATYSTPLPAGKFDVNHNHARKVAFESEFALLILKEYKEFLPLLHKIGHEMCAYLNALSDRDKELAGKKFKQYFYTNKSYFGRIGPSSDFMPPLVALANAQTVMTKGKKIEEIMFAHMAMLAILKEINTKNQYMDIYQKYIHIIRPNALFTNRGREKTNQKQKPTTRVGIQARSTVRSQLSEHTRAVDEYVRDTTNPSSFVMQSFEKEIPFVAGPSGSAAECMLSAIVFTKNQLMLDELQAYAMCCVAYLVGSGAHSFHEILTVGKQIGLSYEDGQYATAIPDFIQQLARYKQLAENFSDIIDAANADNFSESASTMSDPSGPFDFMDMDDSDNTIKENTSATAASAALAPNNAIAIDRDGTSPAGPMLNITNTLFYNRDVAKAGKDNIKKRAADNTGYVASEAKRRKAEEQSQTTLSIKSN